MTVNTIPAQLEVKIGAVLESIVSAIPATRKVLSRDPQTPLEAILNTFPVSPQIFFKSAINTKPVPPRDFTMDPQKIAIRSFNFSNPDAEVEELKGVVAGGSILHCVLKVGDGIGKGVRKLILGGRTPVRC